MANTKRIPATKETTLISKMVLLQSLTPLEQWIEGWGGRGGEWGGGEWRWRGVDLLPASMLSNLINVQAEARHIKWEGNWC